MSNPPYTSVFGAGNGTWGTLNVKYVSYQQSTTPVTAAQSRWCCFIDIY